MPNRSTYLQPFNAPGTKMVRDDAKCRRCAKCRSANRPCKTNTLASTRRRIKMHWAGGMLQMIQAAGVTMFISRTIYKNTAKNNIKSPNKSCCSPLELTRKAEVVDITNLASLHVLKRYDYCLGLITFGISICQSLKGVMTQRSVARPPLRLCKIGSRAASALPPACVLGWLTALQDSPEGALAHSPTVICPEVLGMLASRIRNLQSAPHPANGVQTAGPQTTLPADWRVGQQHDTWGVMRNQHMFICLRPPVGAKTPRPEAAGCAACWFPCFTKAYSSQS